MQSWKSVLERQGDGSQCSWRPWAVRYVGSAFLAEGGLGGLRS